jgi:hypothetical protein
MAKRKVSNYKTDRRRKHHHWLVTVTYSDNESFGRVYIDRERAEKFAAEEITGREEDPHTTVELKKRAVMATRPACIRIPLFLFAQRRSRWFRRILLGLVLP